MDSEISITPSLQNYIEVLYELNSGENDVRVTDLARRLGIAKSSVNQATRQLVRLGFALHERYGRIHLTGRGIEYAAELEKRHLILETFFTDVLKVDSETANRDACIIEHVISPVTITKLTEYLETHEDLKCGLPGKLPAVCETCGRDPRDARLSPGGHPGRRAMAGDPKLG